MKLTKHNEDGFIEAVLIAIIVIVITLLGVTFLRNRNENTADPNTSSKNTSQHCFASNRVCITGPSGWTVSRHEEDVPGDIALVSPDSKSGAKIYWATNPQGETNQNKIIDEYACSTTTKCFGTLVSATALPKTTGISDVQVVYRIVYIDSATKSTVTSIEAYEIITPTVDIASSGLTLGKEVQVTNSISQSILVPLTFNKSQAVFVGAKLSPISNSPYEQADVSGNPAVYFHTADAQKVHKSIIGTRVDQSAAK